MSNLGGRVRARAVRAEGALPSSSLTCEELEGQYWVESSAHENGEVAVGEGCGQPYHALWATIRNFLFLLRLQEARLDMGKGQGDVTLPVL